jgi:DNA gyrase/topoisomerase IV subunit A
MSRDTARCSSNQQIFYCVAVHEIPEGSTTKEGKDFVQKKEGKDRNKKNNSATIQLRCYTPM